MNNLKIIMTMLFYLQTDKSDISFGGTHRKLLTHITKKKKKIETMESKKYKQQEYTTTNKAIKINNQTMIILLGHN